MDVDTPSPDAIQRSVGESFLVNALNQLDDQGRTVLMVAVYAGQEENVKLILPYAGVDINCVDYHQRSPLIVAALHEHKTIAALLLSRPDIDVNVQDEGGRSALMMAIMSGNKAIVGLILAHTSEILESINSRDRNGDTALIMAAERGQRDIVRMLLEVDGIDTAVVGSHGHTALSAARSRGHGAVATLIQDHEIAQQTNSPELKEPQPGPYSGLLEALSLDLVVENKAHSSDGKRSDEAVADAFLDTTSSRDSILEEFPFVPPSPLEDEGASMPVLQRDNESVSLDTLDLIDEEPHTPSQNEGGEPVLDDQASTSIPPPEQPRPPPESEGGPLVLEWDNRRVEEFFSGGARSEVGLTRHRHESRPNVGAEMNAQVAEATVSTTHDPPAEHRPPLLPTKEGAQPAQEQFFYGGGKVDQNVPLVAEGAAVVETNVNVDANENATTILGGVTHLAVSSGGVLNVAGRDVNHHQHTVYQDHQQVALYYQELRPMKDLQDRRRKERRCARYCASCNIQ